MIFGFLSKIFKTKNQREVNRLNEIVDKINEIELQYQKLSDTELKAKTQEFKDRINNGETVDQLLCETYATVKNTCKRLCGTEITVCNHTIIWNMIPFDVQIMGGIALKECNVAEMATGEGKTLVATMPLYLHSLTGKNCHLVTVSDYHAKRDSEWMKVIYDFLGISVGCIQNSMTTQEKKEQYEKDITYGTNSEFGFDYLRDMGISNSVENMVQKGHYFVIIDEVDSILIDEARTPLIISGPTANITSNQYNNYKRDIEKLFQKQKIACTKMIESVKEYIEKKQFTDEVVTTLLQVKMCMPKHKQLLKLMENHKLSSKISMLEANLLNNNINRDQLYNIQSELYFIINEKNNEADLTDKGRNEISNNHSESFTIPDIFDELNIIEKDIKFTEEEKIFKKKKLHENISKISEKIHNISQLIKGYCLFEKDIDYVVQNNKVIIVDQHTGRLMSGRRFSEGLHQALEAKENVVIKEETQTLATITIQNYFRMYEKLSGMTGTAESEANELFQIYNMHVIVIPTNKPCIRKDYNDIIYKSKREKYNAIINEIVEYNNRKQPVLVGTISVEVSEILGRMLKIKKIKHNVLNAKHHQYEADIIANAGKFNSVTVATNMAGRGTDIKLEQGTEEIGGLHVIGTERHNARRIDKQLRGRCSRQGDPGSSKFFISLEDDLMRLFGSNTMISVMNKLGLKDGDHIQHGILNKSIETAQKRVESFHFQSRKATLEFDDIINKHRKIIYKLRNKILISDDLKNIIFDMIYIGIFDNIDNMINANNDSLKTQISNIIKWIKTTFQLTITEEELLINYEQSDKIDITKIILDKIIDKIKVFYEAKESIIDDKIIMNKIEKYILLEEIDKLWYEHLYLMDELRKTITFRTYAQKDPLTEYRYEAFNEFEDMMKRLNHNIINSIFRSQITLDFFERIAKIRMTKINTNIEQLSDSNKKQHVVNNINKEEKKEEDIEIIQRKNINKINRNEQCSCGSRKKYKKCCGK